MRSRTMWKMLAVSAGIHALAIPWAAGRMEIHAPAAPRASRVRVTLESIPAVRKVQAAPEAEPPGPAVRKRRAAPPPPLPPPSRVIKAARPAAQTIRPVDSAPPPAARATPEPVQPKEVRPPATARRKPVPRAMKRPRRAPPPTAPASLPPDPLEAASLAERPARWTYASPPEPRRRAEKTGPVRRPGASAAPPPSPLGVSKIKAPPRVQPAGAASLKSSVRRSPSGAGVRGRTPFRLRALSRTAPVYPAEARRRGVEGTVLLRLKILLDGRVGKVEVARSSGSALLDRAASRSASSWRFAFDGDPPPLGAWAKIPVRFKIVAP